MGTDKDKEKKIPGNNYFHPPSHHMLATLVDAAHHVNKRLGFGRGPRASRVQGRFIVPNTEVVGGTGIAFPIPNAEYNYREEEAKDNLIQAGLPEEITKASVINAIGPDALAASSTPLENLTSDETQLRIEQGVQQAVKRPPADKIAEATAKKNIRIERSPLI